MEDLDDNDDTDDLSITNVGLDIVARRFICGFELRKGTETDDSEDTDFTAYDFKIGFRPVNKEHFNLGIIAALNSKLYDDDYDTSFYATLIGVNLGFNIADIVYIEGLTAFSIAGYVEGEYYDGWSYDYIDEDVYCAIIKAKCTYFLTEHLGLSVGYQYYSYLIDNEYESQITDSVLTAGLALKF